MFEGYRDKKAGFIFDMDGVIINTWKLHEESWKIIARAYQLPWDEKLNFKKDVFGTCSKDSVTILFKHHIENFELRKICSTKETVYFELLRQNIESAVVPGFIEFFKQLVKTGSPIALATSSTEYEADFVLKSLGIFQDFKVMMDISKVSHPKPHPEIYMKACQALGLPPRDCVGFEDSISGITALSKAGVPCIVVGSTLTYEKLVQSGLHFFNYIPDFSHIASCEKFHFPHLVTYAPKPI